MEESTRPAGVNDHEVLQRLAAAARADLERVRGLVVPGTDLESRFRGLETQLEEMR